MFNEKDTRDYGITLQYFSKPTKDYPYEEKVEIVLDSDISAREAILAFVKLLRDATYNIDYKTLEQVALDMKDGWI